MKLTKTSLNTMIKQCVLELYESGELDMQTLVEDVVLEVIAANKDAIVKAVLRESNRRVVDKPVRSSQGMKSRVAAAATSRSMSSVKAQPEMKQPKSVLSQNQNVMSEAAELFGNYAALAVDTLSDVNMQKFLAEEAKHDRQQSFLADPAAAMTTEVEEGPSMHINRLRSMPYQGVPATAASSPAQVHDRHDDISAQHAHAIHQAKLQHRAADVALSSNNTDDVHVPDDLSALGLGKMQFDIDAYNTPRAAASTVRSTDNNDAILQQIFNDQMGDLSK